jgi:hypothetical protein
MGEIKRTIIVTKKGKEEKVSEDYHRPIDFPCYRIVSIKTKDVDITDIFVEITMIDNRVPPQKITSTKFYLGDYGTRFVEHLGYLVLYTNDLVEFKIKVPPNTYDIIISVPTFKNSTPMGDYAEVVVNTVSEE